MLTIIAKDSFILDAASFYARALGIDHLPGEIEITIGKIVNGPQGYCDDNGDDFYEIGIDNSDPELVLSTLAHEMVHVKQFITREMVGLVKGTLWKGDFYPDLPQDGSNEYYNRPWEKEAFGREMRLTVDFITAKFVSPQGSC